MTKLKTQDSVPHGNKRKKTEDGDGDSDFEGVKEVVPTSPARPRRQVRQIIKQDESSDFEEEDESPKRKKTTKKKAPKKQEANKSRSQIGSFFGKVGDGKSESPTTKEPTSNPPSPKKSSPQRSPKTSPKTKNKKNTSKSPPPPLPQPSKIHPFFASKEQKAALEKEREAAEKERETAEKEKEEAELKQREEQLREKERLLFELEQSNKSKPTAHIFLSKEQKKLKKLAQERDALLEQVRKSREETARLSEGKKPIPFLLPRTFEQRAASEKSEDRASTMLINQIRLPYFPETAHVLQESPAPQEPPLANGHLASRTRVRERVRAAAHAEVPAVYTAHTTCKNLTLVPRFSEMMSTPKQHAPASEKTVRSCTLKYDKNKTKKSNESTSKHVDEQLRLLDLEGAARVPPISSELREEYTKKHFAFCSYENYNTTEENPLWTETYRPQLSSEILGNKDGVTLLHSWLERWREKEERRWAKAREQNKPKLKRLKRDKGDKLSNAVLLVGPHGSGKTASIYAIAKELGFEIIETNASCRRTGKQLTELFGEAVKSHQLQKTADEDGPMRFTHSLILVEEVDIQHGDDKGFLPTLTQLATTTKRPFVFVCNEITPAIKQLSEATSLVTIKFSTPPASVSTYPMRVISAIEGLLTEDEDVTKMVTWLGCDLRQSLLNLQFWTQGCQLVAEKSAIPALKLRTDTVYYRWLGFGEFEKKYGSNLWVMLENSAKLIEPPEVPSKGTPSKGTKKKRGSTSKGKRGKQEADSTTSNTALSNTTPSNSNARFWDDQERFLSHAFSLGIDFIFPHYLTLLSSPYFQDELFTSIANKAIQPTCTIDQTNTPLPTTTDETTKDDYMDTTDDAKPDSEIVTDNSNDSSALPSSQDSQHSLSSQSSQTFQLPPLPQPQRSIPTTLLYVDKASKEFQMAQIGCDALDAMACAADTLSLRDLLSSRDAKLDLLEYIDEKEDERVKDKLEINVTCPSYQSNWPIIPFDEELITSLSALSLHRIHSTQQDVQNQLTTKNLARIPSDLSRTSSDFLSPPDLSRASSTLSDLLTPPTSQPSLDPPTDTTNPQQPTLNITWCDGLILHTSEYAPRIEFMSSFIPFSAYVGRQSLAIEYMPYVQQMCEYEDLRRKSNPKRGDRFKHYLGNDTTELQKRIREFSLNACK